MGQLPKLKDHVIIFQPELYYSYTTYYCIIKLFATCVSPSLFFSPRRCSYSLKCNATRPLCAALLVWLLSLLCALTLQSPNPLSSLIIITWAVFRCRNVRPDLAAAATVFLSEHCSSFCFLVQKIVQKLIN
jgi:hypothetical protein